MEEKLIDVFWWESCITDHQLYTLIELTQIPNINLRTRVLRLTNSDRKRQGWIESDISLINAEVISAFRILFFLKNLRKYKNSVHIFAGPFDSFWITLGLFMAIFINKNVYVLTEPYSPITAQLLTDGNKVSNWILSKIRPLKYKFLWFAFRRRVKGVFAISPLAVKQLLHFGLDPQKIFRFAYFIPAVNLSQNTLLKSDALTSFDGAPLRVIFVGSLTSTKGLDLAVDAINQLNNMKIDITLDVFGPGRRVNAASKSPTVLYKGIIPFGMAQFKIAEYDLLLLPSRYDGWGVVVNEALLAGVPVVCSNSVGASGLIKKWGCGASYDDTKGNALVELLVDVCANKDARLRMWKDSIPNVSEIILPKSGAKYLVDCLNYDILETQPMRNNWYD